ncbi:MAG: Crp/Fnr family transcriptional regulator [Silvibacterium sp.]
MASGTELIQQGRTVASVYLVRRGLVKLVYLSESGEEITLGLRSVGWWGGAVAAMLDSFSACSVQAVGECEVIRISGRDFRERLKSNPSMMGHFLKALCNENASQTEAQARVMSGTAAERLTIFMRERQKKNPRWQTIDPLPMLKQMELAQLLSITPEHLSRLLSRMRSEQRKQPA